MNCARTLLGTDVMENHIVESLITNALAYQSSCVSPLQSHREQARAVLTALAGARYVLVNLPDKDAILPALDEVAGLRYYFGTEKGYLIASALLAARSLTC